MAINKKNKNRTAVGDKEYLWWVFDEQDQTAFDGIQIKVVCSDQTHFIKYGLEQRDESRKVVLALRDYAKMVMLAAPPKFENEEGIITNSGITRLVKWCQDENHQPGYAIDTDRSDHELSDADRLQLLREIQKIMR